MQEPSTGNMFDEKEIAEKFSKAGETVNQTAARLGFPIWTVGELVTIKGIKWSIAEIRPGTKEMVLRYHSKADGIAAMMERVAGQVKSA